MNTKKVITVGTHNGIFHQDEVVAVALLFTLYGDCISVKRTRNLRVLNNCDIVVDVGGGEFDHHLPGGNGIRKSGTPYASAGLVWKSFGKNILSKFGCTDKLLSNTFNAVDRNIIENVDKIDNGIMTSSLFDYISIYNPSSNESPDELDERFSKVLDVTIKILSTAIKKEIENVNSDSILTSLIESCNSRILEIPSQYTNWRQLVTLYNTFPKHNIDFVVFPYPTGGYAAQSVPPSMAEPFKQRVPFPSTWAGLTITLPEVSGIKTAIFCHNNLFFVRAETKEDVYALCKIAIDQH